MVTPARCARGPSRDSRPRSVSQASSAPRSSIAAALVAPGGRLGYVVCSLLDREGPDQVEAFLARTPGWRAEAPGLPAGTARGPGIRLTPSHDGTDGFFIARLART